MRIANTTLCDMTPCNSVDGYQTVRRHITENRNAHLKFDLISGFRRDVDEICALLGCYAASCGNCLPKRRLISEKSAYLS